MKRYISTLAIAALAVLVVSACSKEQDLSGYVTADQVEALQQQIESQNSEIEGLNSQIDDLNSQIDDLNSQSEDQTKLYEFNITFPAIEDEYVSEVTYNGLVGKLKEYDALVAYVYTNDGWLQLPASIVNQTFNIRRYDNGSLKFLMRMVTNITFSQAALTTTIRAFVIPQEPIAKGGKVFSSMSYEEMLEATGLTENDVQTL